MVFYCVAVYCTTICIEFFSWGLPVFWDRPEHRGPFWRPQPSPCEPCVNADKVLFCITYCTCCVALWSAKTTTHCEDFVTGDHHQDRHGFVHQGQRAMLQFSCQDALWVHVGQLLDFLLTRKKDYKFSCKTHSDWFCILFIGYHQMLEYNTTFNPLRFTYPIRVPLLHAVSWDHDNTHTKKKNPVWPAHIICIYREHP